MTVHLSKISKALTLFAAVCAGMLLQPMPKTCSSTAPLSAQCLAPKLKTNRQTESMELLKRFCDILKEKEQISNTPDLTQMVTAELMGWLDLVDHLLIIYSNDHDKVLELLTKAIGDQYFLFSRDIYEVPGAPERVLPFVPHNFPLFTPEKEILDFFNARLPIDKLDFFETGKDFKSIAVTSDNLFTDGLGDVAHVLAMATSLQQRFPDKDINIYLPSPVAANFNHPDSLLLRWQQKYMKYLKDSGFFEKIKWFENSKGSESMLSASFEGVKNSGIGEDVILTVPCPQMIINKTYIPENSKLILSVSEYQSDSSIHHTKRIASHNGNLLFSLRHTGGILPNIGLHFPDNVLTQAQLLKANIYAYGYEHTKQTALQTLFFTTQLSQYQQNLNLSKPLMLLTGVLVKNIKQRMLTSSQLSRRDNTRFYLNSVLNENEAFEVIEYVKRQLPHLQFSDSLKLEQTLLKQISSKALELLDNTPDLQHAASVPWTFAYCTYTNSVRKFINEMEHSANSQNPVLLFNLSSPLSAAPQDNFKTTTPQSLAYSKLENGINALNLQTIPHYFFIELMLLSSDIMTTGDQSTVEALISSAVMENKILSFEAREHKQDFVIHLLQHLGKAGYEARQNTSNMTFTFPYGNFSSTQIRTMRIETSQAAKTLMENANMINNLVTMLDKAWKKSNSINYMREVFESFSKSA